MFCVHQIDKEMQQIDEKIQQIDEATDGIDVVYAKTMSDAEDTITMESSTGQMVCDLIAFYNQK